MKEKYLVLRMDPNGEGLQRMADLYVVQDYDPQQIKEPSKVLDRLVKSTKFSNEVRNAFSLAIDIKVVTSD